MHLVKYSENKEMYDYTFAVYFKMWMCKNILTDSLIDGHLRYFQCFHFHNEHTETPCLNIFLG